MGKKKVIIVDNQGPDCYLHKTKCDGKLYGFRNNQPEEITGGGGTPANFTGVAVNANWLTSGHNSGARYCRIKTVAERGYKLVVQDNKVLVVDPSDKRIDMPIGMERGIALRYMNR